MEQEQLFNTHNVIDEDEFLKQIGIQKDENSTFKVILKSVPDNDKGQCESVSKTETHFHTTVRNCVEDVKHYISKWNLTQNNFPVIKIWHVWFNDVVGKAQKKAIARVAYNGRVWTLDYTASKVKEVKYK